MVITVGMTWNGVADLGYVHWLLNIVLLNTVLFALIAAQATVAIFNQCLRRDGTLRRMIPTRGK